MSRRDITSEKITMVAEENNPDKAFLAAVTGENGPLAPGCIPALELGTAAGSKAMAESLAGGAVQKGRPNVDKHRSGKMEATTVQETLG